MKLTLLEIIGNTVQLLILVVLPIVLAIKYWDITLKIMKILLKFVISSTPKVIEFIIPILEWAISPAPEDNNSRSSNNYGKSGKVVDAGKTYQNGLDGAQRVPGKTFY